MEINHKLGFISLRRYSIPDLEFLLLYSTCGWIFSHKNMQKNINHSTKGTHCAYYAESHDVLWTISRWVQICPINWGQISQRIDNGEANGSGLVGHSAKGGRCITQAERIAGPDGSSHEHKEDIAADKVIHNPEDDGTDCGDDQTAANDQTALMRHFIRKVSCDNVAYKGYHVDWNGHILGRCRGISESLNESWVEVRQRTGSNNNLTG